MRAVALALTRPDDGCCAGVGAQFGGQPSTVSPLSRDELMLLDIELTNGIVLMRVAASLRAT